MRRSGFSILLVIMVSLIMATSISAKPRTLQALVDAYFEDYFKANPTHATSVGFHQYDHQLEDFSLAAHQRYRRALLSCLKDVQATNTAPPPPNAFYRLEIKIASLNRNPLQEDTARMCGR